MRKLVVILGLVAVFLVACSSGGDDSVGRPDSDTQEPAATAVVPTSVPEPTVAPEPTAESQSDGGLFEGALSPFNLMSLGSGGETEGLTVTGEGDPALKAALLTADDLPPDYVEMMPGGMSFSMETAEGAMDMAASIFAKGEAVDAMPEGMVMSAVVAAPGGVMEESMAELERYSEPGALEREIQDAMGASEEMFGFKFEDLKVLDASGLGEGGLGLHMVMSMDLEAFAEGFGAEMEGEIPAEADIMKEGIAFDMYTFARGDNMLMVMVMWPGDGSAPVDARALAEVMDSRAEAAF